MAKVTFEIEIEAEEVPEAYDMLRDIVEAFEFPVYEIGCKYGDGSLETQIGGTPRDTVTLPSVELDAGTRAFLEGLCGTACDEIGDPRPSLGDIVELGWFEYIVHSTSIDGELHLIPRDELVDEKDHPLG